MSRTRKAARGGTMQWAALAAGLAAALPLLLVAQESPFLQHGFETRDPVLTPGAADATYRETAHRMTEATAHSGQRSEFLQIEAREGNYIHYTSAVGKAPVTEELSASLWVKANRPGIQLLVRVVLPHERDSKNLDQPLTTVLRGDAYQNAGRWQRVELRKAVKALTTQQQLLRAELGRNVSVADAYVDQVLVNVYAGPGLTQVWLDDLEVGPVLDAKQSPPLVRPEEGGPSGTGSVPRPAAEIKLQREQIVISGKKFFLRGIRHSGTPLKTLRDAGFNTVWVDEGVDAEVIEQAVGLGFWLAPILSTDRDKTPVAHAPGSPVAQLTSNQLVSRRMARFLHQDAVLCWDMGGGLAAEEYTSISRAAQAVRTADPQRPLAADVWDGFQRYSRGIDQVMLGVHRWPLMTGLELNQYREWLTQRRQLAQPGTYTWTWIQTHLPEWFTAQAYEKPSAVGFAEPIGPQPEQVRLLTYTALAAGCRGVGYWSDRFLADTHTGRDRLLQLALLNLEMQLLEPLLVSAKTPLWIKTSEADVQAAVMLTDYGVLCLPMWMGKGSQFVPGQGAKINLAVTVPTVPAGTQAWLVSPGEVRTLKMERVIGGTKVVLPEFGLTAAIVFTGDLSPTGLVVRFQDQVRRMARSAAQWSHDLAEEEYAKVGKVHETLESMGKPLPDGRALLADARRRIVLCAQHRRNGDAREAYLEAQRAMRPLRILMRAHWEEATKELDTPTASPYAVSFYTLPRHWRFRNEVATSKLTKNVLPEGDFEKPSQETSTQWRVQEETSLDEVVQTARRVADAPQQGKQALALEIKAKDAKLAPLALERTFLAMHSPAVKVPPGTLVRISGWVKIPADIKASADGVLLYDSAGGEPLAVRLKDAVKEWKKYTLFRRVPASGTIQVSLALTGLGKVYFDDVKVEPLEPGTGLADPALQQVGHTEPAAPRR